MAVLMEDRREFPYLNVTPGFGNLAVGTVNAVNNTWPGWQSCREVIQKQFSVNDPGLWFSYENKELSGIIEFMSWVENTLQIKDRTRFYQTEPLRYFSWLEPASFWKSSEMRKNAFTMFLRVGRVYAIQQGKKSYKKALLGYRYSQGTMLAVERFLMGFTNYVGPELVPASPQSGLTKMGWYSQFFGKDEAYIRANLKSPEWIAPPQEPTIEPVTQPVPRATYIIDNLVDDWVMASPPGVDYRAEDWVVTNTN